MMKSQQAEPSASTSARGSFVLEKKFARDINGNLLDRKIWITNKEAELLGLYPSLLYHLRMEKKVRVAQVPKEELCILRGPPVVFLYYLPDLEQFSLVKKQEIPPEIKNRLQMELAAFPNAGGFEVASLACLSRTNPEYAEEFFSNLSPMVESLISVFGSSAAPLALEAIAGKKELEEFGVSSQLPLLEQKQDWGAISRHVQEWCSLSIANLWIIYRHEMGRAGFSFAQNGAPVFEKSYFQGGEQQLSFSVSVPDLAYSINGEPANLRHIIMNGAPRRLKIDAYLLLNLQSLLEKWLSVGEFSAALDWRLSGQMRYGEEVGNSGEPGLEAWLHHMPLEFRASGNNGNPRMQATVIYTSSGETNP